MDCTVTLLENQLLKLSLEVCLSNVLCWRARVSVRRRKRRFASTKNPKQSMQSCKNLRLYLPSGNTEPKLATKVNLCVPFGISGNVWLTLACLDGKVSQLCILVV